MCNELGISSRVDECSCMCIRICEDDLMSRGNRAIEQLSNRAIEQSSNRAIEQLSGQKWVQMGRRKWVQEGWRRGGDRKRCTKGRWGLAWREQGSGPGRYRTMFGCSNVSRYDISRIVVLGTASPSLHAAHTHLFVFMFESIIWLLAYLAGFRGRRRAARQGWRG